MKNLRKSGFTLLELLVVIALLAVATTLGVTTLFKSTDVWNIYRTRAELDARADNIFETMRADFAAVVDPGDTGVPLVGASATAQDQRFHMVPLADDSVRVPVLLTSAQGGLFAPAGVLYGIDRAGGRNALVRTATELGGQPGAESGTAIAEGVLQMKVEYAPADGSPWVAAWDRPDLPRAVRVSLTLTDPDTWRDYVARKAVFPLSAQ